MSSKLNRVAAGVFAALTALALVDVSTSLAQVTPIGGGDVVSTTCGAGTLERCAEQRVDQCSWDIDFKFSVAERSFSFHIKKDDCKPVGTVPIYKDNPRDSYVQSGSCDLLAEFLGMPRGSGCS
jgi:hypothetical protein